MKIFAKTETKEVNHLAGFTRKAIKETFITLLEERPISEITVKDIVETCGINRNSFYYHFQPEIRSVFLILNYFVIILLSQLLW